MSTISPSLPQPTRTASLPNSLEGVDNCPSWEYLVPTIGILALGAFFIPSSVPIGIAAGVGVFVFDCGVMVTLYALNVIVEDENSEYDKLLHQFPSLATLVAPILEEGFFRGLLQPLTTRAILFIAPAAAAMFLGTGLSIAVTVSIVATAAIFGFIHIFNDHKNSPIQAFTCFAGGIVFGVIAAQFGLPAAIAAHIVNNTIAITLRNIGKAFENRTHS